MDKDEIINALIKSFTRSSAERFFNFIHVRQKGESALLFRLLESGGESTPGKLAETLGVSAARIAAMLRSLEIKELVSRVCDESDKRRVTVKITEAGKRLAETISADIERHARIFLDRLGEEDVKEFLRLMGKCSLFFESFEADENKSAEDKDGGDTYNE